MEAIRPLIEVPSGVLVDVKILGQPKFSQSRVSQTPGPLGGRAKVSVASDVRTCQMRVSENPGFILETSYAGSYHFGSIY